MKGRTGTQQLALDGTEKLLNVSKYERALEKVEPDSHFADKSALVMELVVAPLARIPSRNNDRRSAALEMHPASQQPR